MSRSRITLGRGDERRRAVGPAALLDVLSVAAVVLDAEGRIVLWSPQAEELFGYTAEEALGRYAARLLVHDEHRRLVVKLFAEVMATRRELGRASSPSGTRTAAPGWWSSATCGCRTTTGTSTPWASPPTRRRCGGWSATWPCPTRLVAQSPIGLAVLDTDLRYVSVNPALERINGLPAAEHIGRTSARSCPSSTPRPSRPPCAQVLATGTRSSTSSTVGRTPADPDHDHAWSVSLLPAGGPQRAGAGLATSVVDVTEQHRAATEAARARRAPRARSPTPPSASAPPSTWTRPPVNSPRSPCPSWPTSPPWTSSTRCWTAAPSLGSSDGPALFRALAVAAALPHRGRPRRRPARRHRPLRRRPADHPVRAHRPRRSCVPPRQRARTCARIARDPRPPRCWPGAGVHSYLAVPLIARGEVLGALDLKRTRNPLPFDEDDVAPRRRTGRPRRRVHRQRPLVPERTQHRPHPPAQPAAPASRRDRAAWRSPPATSPPRRPARSAATGSTSSRWTDDKTALVVGDVMGSGINAAATMGQLRTATRTLAELDLDPAECSATSTEITAGLEQSIATCVYAVYDPAPGTCRHRHRRTPAARPRPRPDGAAGLLDLPTGAPLGVGGVAFSHRPTVDLRPGDQLVLYTDGLVETRDQPIDERLDALLALLAEPGGPLEETCDLLLTRAAPTRTTTTTWPCSSPAPGPCDARWDRGAAPLPGPTRRRRRDLTATSWCRSPRGRTAPRDGRARGEAAPVERLDGARRLAFARLDQQTAAGREPRGASAATRRSTSRPSAPPSRATRGSWSRASGGQQRDLAGRDVRHVRRQDVDTAAQCRRAAPRTGRPRGPARRAAAMLRRAQRTAAGSMSAACSSTRPSAAARAAPTAPEPQHRSTTTGRGRATRERPARRGTRCGGGARRRPVPRRSAGRGTRPSRGRVRGAGRRRAGPPWRSSSAGVRAVARSSSASSSAKTQPAARSAATTTTGGTRDDEGAEGEKWGMEAESLSGAEGRSRGRLPAVTAPPEERAPDLTQR